MFSVFPDEISQGLHLWTLDLSLRHVGISEEALREKYVDFIDEEDLRASFRI